MRQQKSMNERLTTPNQEMLAHIKRQLYITRHCRVHCLANFPEHVDIPDIEICRYSSYGHILDKFRINQKRSVFTIELCAADCNPPTAAICPKSKPASKVPQNLKYQIKEYSLKSLELFNSTNLSNITASDQLFGKKRYKLEQMFYFNSRKLRHHNKSNLS